MGWLEVECNRCARRARACRSMRCEGRVIRRSGSWKPRPNAGRAERDVSPRPSTWS